MSVFAQAMRAAFNVASATVDGLARRQAQQPQDEHRRKKKKKGNCSICGVMDRQERAERYINDIKVLAGTRRPRPARRRPSVKGTE